MDELPREAFGVRGACSRFRPTPALRQRQPVLRSSTAEGGQAGRTPNAARNLVAALSRCILRVLGVRPLNHCFRNQALVVGGQNVYCCAVTRYGSDVVFRAFWIFRVKQQVNETAKEIVYLLLDIHGFGAVREVMPKLLKLGVVIAGESPRVEGLRRVKERAKEPVRVVLF